MTRSPPLCSHANDFHGGPNAGGALASMDPLQLRGTKRLRGRKSAHEVMVKTREELGGRSILDRPERRGDVRHAGRQKGAGDADARLADAAVAARGPTGGQND